MTEVKNSNVNNMHSIQNLKITQNFGSNYSWYQEPCHWKSYQIRRNWWRSGTKDSGSSSWPRLRQGSLRHRQIWWMHTCSGPVWRRRPK